MDEIIFYIYLQAVASVCEMSSMDEVGLENLTPRWGFGPHKQNPTIRYFV